MTPLDSSPAQPGAWRVMAASVRGVSHQKTGLPCQDALEWKQWPSGLLAVALADGAGSASLAEVGAAVAARAGLEALAAGAVPPPEPVKEEKLRALLLSALATARAAVLAEAQRRQAKTRDLATTLAVLLATANWAAAAQVGDGAAVLAGPDQVPRVLTQPAASEYLNETTFLTADQALATAAVQLHFGRLKHLALFCDGLQMLALKLPAAEPHAPFFGPLFRFVESAADLAAGEDLLRAFLQSPRVTQRTADDLTLLLASVADSPPALG